MTWMSSLWPPQMIPGQGEQDMLKWTGAQQQQTILGLLRQEPRPVPLCTEFSPIPCSPHHLLDYLQIQQINNKCSVINFGAISNYHFLSNQ
jgi:hypothetical protein